MIRRLFEVELDLRSLAALRVVLGGLVFLDAIMRFRDLGAFYTDLGVLPRATLLEVPHPTLLSLMMSVGEPAGAAVWLGLLAVAGLGLAAGWNTRWCTLGAWVLHTAVKHRNPFILDGGDLELGLILWWGFFLPLGARYSWDSRRHPEWRRLPDSYSSVATSGYVLQISLMYLFAALSKSDPIWWKSGDALYYILNLDVFATSLGRFVSTWGQPQLRALTFAALGLEFLIPLALWMPIRRKAFRYLGCVLIGILHLSIGLMLNLGLMVFINVMVTVGMWPGSLVERVFSRITRLEKDADGGAEGNGAGDACPGYKLKRSMRVFLVTVGVYLVYFNIAVLSDWIVPYPIKLAAYPLRLQQDWKLFAPHPGVDDGWLLARATQVSGSTIDLLNGGAAVNYGKPKSVASTVPNQRWRAWRLNLIARNDRRVYESYCLWLAREWNERHRGPEAVRHVTLTLVSEPTPPPGTPLKSHPTDLYDLELPIELYQKPNEVYVP